MPRHPAQLFRQRHPRRRQQPPVAQEVPPLLPHQPAEDPQPAGQRGIQQPPARHLVNPQRVESRRRDPREIPREILRPAARKGPVSHRPQLDALSPGPEEFAIDTQRLHRGKG